MGIFWLYDWIQHLMWVATSAAHSLYIIALHWLGFCATCICTRLGQCIDWGGIAGGVAAAAAAAAGATGSPSNNKDKCAGERRGVEVARGLVDMYKSQIGAYAGQLEKMKKPADELIAEASELAGPAQNEMAWNLVQELITKVLEFAVKESPLGEIYEAGNAVVDPVGALPGAEYYEFFQELVGYFSLMDGGFDAVEKRAEEEGLTTTLKFLEKMRELQDLRNNAQEILSNINHIRMDLDEAERKLKDAQQQLAECEATAANVPD